MACPNCGSDMIKKNGHIENGKQNHRCKACGRQFVLEPANKVISQETWNLVDKLLLERLSLAGISRVTGISEAWLQQYVNRKYATVERSFADKKSPKKKAVIEVQCDEMWSFVGKKSNKKWIWIAINAGTREIVGLFVGDRSEDGALGLWDSIPESYQKQAEFYTDHWEAYEGVLPQERHFPVDKSSGKTSYIERLNNTIRQRCSRLVRKSLSFSKKVENHIGSLWLFAHHYNLALTM